MTERTTRLNDGEDLEIAHPEDDGVQRDGDGELTPLKQRIPGTVMAVLVKPMRGGDYEAWEDVLEKDEADDDRVDAFLREFIEEGIGSNGLDEVPDYVVPGLVQAVKNGSGHEVFRAMQEQQQRENIAAIEALDGVGDGILETALEEFMEEEMDNETDET